MIVSHSTPLKLTQSLCSFPNIPLQNPSCLLHPVWIQQSPHTHSQHILQAGPQTPKHFFLISFLVSGAEMPFWAQLRVGDGPWYFAISLSIPQQDQSLGPQVREESLLSSTFGKSDSWNSGWSNSIAAIPSLYRNITEGRFHAGSFSWSWTVLAATPSQGWAVRTSTSGSSTSLLSPLTRISIALLPLVTELSLVTSLV